MRPSPPLAEDEAIDLASIGGAISTIYADIGDQTCDQLVH